MSDTEWLAILLRNRLVKGEFHTSQKIREL